MDTIYRATEMLLVRNPTSQDSSGLLSPWGRIPFLRFAAGCCPDVDGKWHVCCGCLVAKDLKSQLHGSGDRILTPKICPELSPYPTTNMKYL